MYCKKFDSLEMLGFKKKTKGKINLNYGKTIEYSKKYNSGGFVWEDEITFWFDKQNYSTTSFNEETENNYPMFIDKETHIAINDKLKELGWL